MWLFFLLAGVACLYILFHHFVYSSNIWGSPQNTKCCYFLLNHPSIIFSSSFSSPPCPSSHLFPPHTLTPLFSHFPPHTSLHTRHTSSHLTPSSHPPHTSLLTPSSHLPPHTSLLTPSSHLPHTLLTPHPPYILTPSSHLPPYAILPLIPLSHIPPHTLLPTLSPPSSHPGYT